jgi:NADH:ubiquinone oxidoreductase subunit F (NADH-binding)
VSAAEYTRFVLPGRLPRLLTGLRADGHAVSLEAHLRLFAPLPAASDLVRLLEASGLRGRGGAAFPTARKFAAVAARPGRPVVVVNAAEGEPASGKDKAILRHNPHLVLDGAVIAAASLGAREAIIAISAEAALESTRVSAAIAERRKRRLDRVALSVVPVPATFLTGEETALVRAIAGGPAKPTLKPPFPFESGLEGRPTLVQNAETLAQLALIARFGSAWFREAGAPDAPGTALVTLSGAVERPGVHEIELGWTLGELLARAGGATEPFSAVLVGGYFGGWIAATEVDSFRLLPDTLGAGAVIVFPDSACAVADSARVLRYLAGESAGQCGPCLNGLAAIADGFERLAAGVDGAGSATLARWARLVSGRGACRHPDGAARFLDSTMQVFPGELARHAQHGRCGKRVRPILPLPHGYPA